MRSKLILAARYGSLLLGLVLLAVGVSKKEYLEVLSKAVTICLECIGIG